MKMFDYNFPAFIADVEKIQTPHPDVWQDLQKLCDTMAAWIQNDIPVHEWPHTKETVTFVYNPLSREDTFVLVEINSETMPET